jgi:endonuclease YncB( thermonuclease family)
MKTIRQSTRTPLLLACCTLALLFTGCDASDSPRAIPAPLRDNFPYSVSGKIGHIWGGDNFDFGHELELHYILVRGLNCPAPGQPFYAQAKKAVRIMTDWKSVDLYITHRDSMMREIADVTFLASNQDGVTSTETLDLATEMIRQGWGRYNREYSDLMPNAKELIALEAAAKESRLGIWADTEPTKP